MEQEIASVINRVLIHQQVPAHIRILNTQRNANGMIKANTDKNVTEEIPRPYCDIIIMAAWTVNKGAIDVKESESWERLKINAVPLIQNIGRRTEGLLKMPEEIEVANQGMLNLTQ